METKKKEKKYFLGIIGGLILGLLFCALTVSAYIRILLHYWEC